MVNGRCLVNQDSQWPVYVKYLFGLMLKYFFREKNNDILNKNFENKYTIKNINYESEV
jgi:hypothetical protein